MIELAGNHWFPLKPIFLLYLSAWAVHLTVRTSSELVFLLVENYSMTTPASAKVLQGIFETQLSKETFFHCAKSADRREEG
jgi:hypothetical protein